MTETVFTPRVPLPALGAVMVETLDRNFESVCELDLIFHSPKVRRCALHTIPSPSHLVSMPAHGRCQHHAPEGSRSALTVGTPTPPASVSVSLTPPSTARPPPHQVHSIIDEIVMGGMVLETNCHEVLRSVGEIAKCVPALRLLRVAPRRGAASHPPGCVWIPTHKLNHAWLSGPRFVNRFVVRADVRGLRLCGSRSGKRRLRSRCYPRPPRATLASSKPSLV